MYTQGLLSSEHEMTMVQTPNSPQSALESPSFYVEFGRNKPGKDGVNYFIRNEYQKLSENNWDEFVQEYMKKNPGWGLYATAFQYNTEDSYVADLRGDFYLDFDDEDNIKNAQEDALRVFQHLTLSPWYNIPANMIRVFFSGKKGIHIIVPYQCFGIEWHPQLDKIYRLMAEELLPYATNQTLDMKVYERRRLFRLKGSQHPSTGSYKVPMELAYILRESEEDIQDLSKDPKYGSWIQYEAPRMIENASRYFQQMEQKFAHRFQKKFSQDGESQTLDFDPPCFQEVIAAGPVKGSRNHIACMLVAFWRQRGYSEQEAWELLIDWNQGSLTERELQTLFRSNYKGRYIYGCHTIKQYTSCPATCKEDCKFFKTIS